jgi:hypothetical protein
VAGGSIKGLFRGGMTGDLYAGLRSGNKLDLVSRLR